MDINLVKQLLIMLQQILHQQGEKNWIRGVTVAFESLGSTGGLEEARSIYASMNQGVGSFADYNIWVEDFDSRIKANAEIDQVREQLWTEFELALTPVKP